MIHSNWQFKDHKISVCFSHFFKNTGLPARVDSDATKTGSAKTHVPFSFTAITSFFRASKTNSSCWNRQSTAIVFTRGSDDKSVLIFNKDFSFRHKDLGCLHLWF